MDGYTLPSGYILKELCIMFQNGEFNHYLFSKPENMMLTEQDKRTIRFATGRVNNLVFEDGDVPYEHINILEKQKDYHIYTYSEVAREELQKYLPTTSIEHVQNLNFKMPANPPKANCFRNHNPRYCAKAKAIEVKKFIKVMKL